MSDELRDIYVKKGLGHRFFDEATPIDLFRAQTFREEKAKLPAIYPNPGFTRGDGEERLPDLQVYTADGQEWVRGCRTIRGDFRGVSMFDRVNPRFKGGRWYKLAKGADIPPPLAVLQDGELSEKYETHFTIAPKDNMPKALFQVWLNSMGDKLVKAE